MTARHRLAALILAAGVGACSTPSAPPSAPPHVAPQGPPAIAATRPAAPPAAKAPAPTAAVPAPPRVASLPPRPLPDPAELVGQSAEAVTARLGAPGFERQDDPARLWRYAAPGCFLDVFLYREGATAVFRVAHVATRGRGGAAVSTGECFRAVLDGGKPDLG